MKRYLQIITAGGFLLAALGSTTVSAVSIAITTGVDNSGTDNVLFNDASLSQSGLLVQGSFSGSGSGYIVDFTSASGNGQIAGSGGQATINGLAGNDPFTSLTFGLEDGATFTAAVLNPDVTNRDGNGTIDFSVSYILGDGLGTYLETLSVRANGQNFFRIDALGDAQITLITYSTSDTTFADTSQFRLGGFASSARVPEGGTTLLMLGAPLAALGLLRRTSLMRSLAA